MSKLSFFNLLAKAISFLFHPLFMYSYMLLIIAQFNTGFFDQLNPSDKGQLLLLNVIYTTIFPLIAIFMMKALGIIPNIYMEEKKDRIGPFIATAIFYSWTYINVRNSHLLPDIAIITLLAVLIGLYLAFLINLVEKISIHGLGTGGMLAFSIYFLIEKPLAKAGPLLLFDNLYLIHVSALVVVGIFVFAIVAWARLQLNQHQLREVLLGNLVGIVAYVFSAMYYF